MLGAPGYISIDILCLLAYFLPVDNYDILQNKAIGFGADLFGVALTARLKDYISLEIADVADSLPFIISIAVRLQKKILETLTDGPNLIYKAHYRQANNLLDKITFGIGQFIQKSGYDAMPISASVITDWDNQRSHLSHRHAAQLAGLGFMGRHGLIVHPEYGAAIRLGSILTDMPLHIDQPRGDDCGDCCACVAACPIGAISVDGVAAFDGKACYELLKQFEKRRGIGVMICGLCIKACKGSKK
jgi:epoxyqueuosine reductase QueG